MYYIHIEIIFLSFYSIANVTEEFFQHFLLQAAKEGNKVHHEKSPNVKKKGNISNHLVEQKFAKQIFENHYYSEVGIFSGVFILQSLDKITSFT